LKEKSLEMGIMRTVMENGENFFFYFIIILCISETPCWKILQYGDYLNTRVIKKSRVEHTCAHTLTRESNKKTVSFLCYVKYNKLSIRPSCIYIYMYLYSNNEILETCV